MKARTLLLVSLAAPVAVAVPVHAKALACYQVNDVTGDAKSADGSNHEPVDIVSGDLATGRKNLVVVIRLKSLGTDPALAIGTEYAFAWSVSGIGQEVSLTRYEDGSQSAMFDPNTSTSSTSDEVRVDNLAVNQGAATITWTIPRTADPALRKGRPKFGGFGVHAGNATNVIVNFPTPLGNVGGQSSFTAPIAEDDAASGRTYVDKTATCVSAT